LHEKKGWKNSTILPFYTKNKLNLSLLPLKPLLVLY